MMMGGNKVTETELKALVAGDSGDLPSRKHLRTSLRVPQNDLDSHQKPSDNSLLIIALVNANLPD